MGRLRCTIAAREDPFVLISGANGQYQLTRYCSLEQLAQAPPGITAIELDPEGRTGIREQGVDLDIGPYLVLQGRSQDANPETYTDLERHTREEVERKMPPVGPKDLFLLRYFV